MKSIHALSALLPGHGTYVSKIPARDHTWHPVKMHGKPMLSTGGGKLSALSSLLAVALFQRRPARYRRSD